MADNRETAGLFVRRVRPADRAAWEPMWADYVSAVDSDPGAVATEATWHRLNDPDSAIVGWIGGRGDGPAEGFVNCVLHPNTFSDRPVCYLEDLYVAPAARGSGLAALLIDTVIETGRQEGWARVYWHTMEDNYRARALYDRYGRHTGYVRYQVIPGDRA